MTARGYFGIGICNTKSALNVGGLWRSAHNFGADWIFTIGKRYRTQASDTTKAAKHVPLYEFTDFADFREHTPRDCLIVGVELDPRAVMLPDFAHPERAVYVLGAEDYGLPPDVIQHCHRLVRIPGAIRCLNVATAGSIVLYDRTTRGTSRAATGRAA
jgi:tRNA (guanosine-2'-O-)-methyltransferase